MPQDWTKLLYRTGVNFQYLVFPVSEARVLSEATCISQIIHVGLVSTACSFRCALLNSRSSLVTLVLGRDIVHDRSTACARDACCKTFFPRDNLARRAQGTVCTKNYREHSRPCCMILHHLSNSTETCEVVLPLNSRLPDYLSRPMCRL